MSEKIKKITVYVENKGRGKALIVDSRLSRQSFPAKSPEGQQAIGVNATKVELPEKHLDAFKGTIKVRYPAQLNVMSAGEYKDIRDGKKESSVDEKTEAANAAALEEQKMFDAAMSGNDEEILVYMEKYPTGAKIAEVKQRVAYLDAKTAGTKKAYTAFLKDYPNSRYSEEIKNTLSQG